MNTEGWSRSPTTGCPPFISSFFFIIVISIVIVIVVVVVVVIIVTVVINWVSRPLSHQSLLYQETINNVIIANTTIVTMMLMVMIGERRWVRVRSNLLLYFVV